MGELIGTFDCDLDELEARASLLLYPGACSFPWSHCGATADFMARLVSSGSAGASPSEDVVSYALNELVENAVKFGSDGLVRVTVGRIDADVVCAVSNRLASSAVASLRHRLAALFDANPREALLRRVETNVLLPASEAGLGILSLLADHDAQVGFRLSPATSDRTEVTAMARLHGTEGCRDANR